MKIRIPVFVIITVCLFTLILTAEAQQAPLILVLNKYKIIPEKVAQFESVMKDFVAEMEKDNCPYEMIMHSTTDFTYYSMWYFENYTMMDRFDEYWGELSAKIGAETMDRYHEQEFGAIQTFSIKLLRYRPGLSYKVGNPRIIGQDVNFIHWEYYYISHEDFQAWNSLQKKWLELYRENELPLPLQTFTGSTGYERPVWIYASWGKSRIDYFTSVEKVTADFGDVMQELSAQNIPLIKSKVERYSYFRRDLSYFPKDKQ